MAGLLDPHLTEVGLAVAGVVAATLTAHGITGPSGHVSDATRPAELTHPPALLAAVMLATALSARTPGQLLCAPATAGG